MTHEPPPEENFSLRRLQAAWQLRLRTERDAAIRLLGEQGLRPRERETSDVHTIALVVPALQLASARRVLTNAGWDRALRGAGSALTRNGVSIVLIPPSAPARAALAAARRASRAFHSRPAEARLVTFLDLELHVPAGVYAPNRTTEVLAHTAMHHFPEGAAPRVADVGSGPGAVAIYLALRCPTADVHGTETSRRAMEAARANARRLGADNACFHHGSLLTPLPSAMRGSLDLVVAHLPWLPPVLLAAERAEGRLARVPAETLTGGDEDGLGLIRQFLPRAAHWLRPGGVLVIQAAAWQTRPLTALLLETGFNAPSARAAGAPLVTRRCGSSSPPAGL